MYKIMDVANFYMLMRRAHSGQFDKAGKPYYLHPLQVEQNAKELLKANEHFNISSDKDQEWLLTRVCAVALCHDVIEDTRYTMDDIREAGADDYVCDALTFCTHNTPISYETYIKNLSQNVISTAVKLADLRHNMDITRLIGVRELDTKDLVRLNKYMKSYSFLIEKFKENMESWYNWNHQA